MTKFDDLHGQFIAWDNALRQHEQNATMIMLAFCNGLRHYLGRDAVSGDPLVLYKINSSAFGTAKYVPVEHFADALSQDADGAWRFGLGLTFTEGGISEQDGGYAIKFPQFAVFSFDLRFTLLGSECVFTNVADNTKIFSGRWESNTLIGFDELCVYISDLIESVFRLKPGEQPQKPPIGFDLTRR